MRKSGLLDEGATDAASVRAIQDHDATKRSPDVKGHISAAAAAAMMLAVTLSAGCTTTEKRTTAGAAVGAGTGAVIGGIAGGGRGAVIGAAAGGVAGALIGRATSPGDCVYKRKDGSTYVARCP